MIYTIIEKIPCRQCLQSIVAKFMQCFAAKPRRQGFKGASPCSSHKLCFEGFFRLSTKLPKHTIDSIFLTSIVFAGKVLPQNLLPCGRCRPPTREGFQPAPDSPDSTLYVRRVKKDISQQWQKKFGSNVHRQLQLRHSGGLQYQEETSQVQATVVRSYTEPLMRFHQMRNHSLDLCIPTLEVQLKLGAVL
mmetsp:Transcript_507/g.3669  ORF Transcript_507/g.3669 Transcript_507/m.3669 type:complete len:190 (+) Transcript_507:2297-2866(+)